MDRRFTLPLTAWAVAGIVLLIGCNQDASDSQASDANARQRIGAVGAAYGAYFQQNNGRPPKDVETFRKYLDSRQDLLTSYNVSSADEFLKSGRDGQPLVVVTGKSITGPDAMETPWAAYEQIGVDGKRIAVTARGGFFEYSPEEFTVQVPVK
jgi:hypothetical protein